MNSLIEEAFQQIIGQLPDDYIWTITELANELHLPRNTVRFQVLHNMPYSWHDSGPVSYIYVTNYNVKFWAKDKLPAIMARQERKHNAQSR